MLVRCELFASSNIIDFVKMARHDLLFLSVMCALCFLSGFTIMVVSAEPTVTAWIITPERDRKLGGRVEMTCVATNLEADHIVEWRTEDPNRTLRWGNTTIVMNRRLMFETKQTGNREITQEFTITDLQMSDDDEYVCNVKEPKPGGGSLNVATARITLRVYPSSESFPICSPDGPITVDTGTQLNMTCSTDTRMPTITVSQIPPIPARYTWIESIIITRSLDLELDASHDNLTFKCSIPSVSYTGETHSCFVGPISCSLRGKTGVATIDTKMITTTSAFTDTTNPKVSSCTNDKSPPTPWIAAFVVAILLLVPSCVLIIFLILYVVKLKRLNNSLTEKLSAKLPQAGPYMELQPTDDCHTAYTDLTTTGATSAQHTYCNTIDTENVKTPDDYEEPENKYEAVGVPKKDKNKL